MDATVLDEPAVAALAARYAGGLVAAGCRPGDAVAVSDGNTARFVAARDATAGLGLRLVPLHPRLAPPEVAHTLATSWARILLADRDVVAPPTRTLSFAELEGLAPPLAVRPAAGSTILFTSGTTGRAKGCLRTEAQEAARVTEVARTYGITAADVHLIVCPLPHSAPGVFVRAARSVGASTVLLPRFEAEAFLAAVRAHRATIFFLVPTQIERLLALPRATADWSSVRAVVVAGAPFSPAARRRFVDWIGPGRLWEFYGSSETGTISVAPPHAPPGEAGFVGFPPPGVEVRIHEPDERGVGQVFVRSPTVMQGYLGPDAGTWRDGFFGLGDLARRDPRGGIVLVDRMFDTIISGGVNVYPAEVEQALAEHPAVATAVVVGLPHPEWGEEVCALVAPRGAAPAEAELRSFLRGRIAPYKIPKRFVFVPRDELPVGPSGKPIRRRARAFFADE